MNETKWFLRSRMIWGVIFFGLGLVGFDVSPEFREVLPGATADVLNDILSIGGLWLAAWGARKGEKGLTVLPKPKPLPWRK